MSVKFGTSGLRGLASDLLGGVASVYATAFIRHLLANGQVREGDKVFIGQDLRDSSPEIADQCVAAVSRAGMVPVRCGALPTPALALYSMAAGAAAIMVSGSHIPADRNGMKYYRPDGEIDKGDEESILSFAQSPSDSARDDGTAVEDEGDQAWQLYCDRCLAILPENALKGARVGVYQHSSVARDFLVRLLEARVAVAVPLGRSERFVPVDTEAVGDETQARLRGWAAEFRLDAIISTDADADRPMLTDENGEQIRGDVLGVIASRFIGATTLVTPVTSNSGIDRVLGLKTVRTRVGSPFVIEAMQEAVAAGTQDGPVVGFEANGGFLLGSAVETPSGRLDPLPTRDSALPILAALARLTDGPLSIQIAALGLPVSISDRLENFPVADSSALMERLNADDKNVAAFLDGVGTPASIDRTDGLRITLDDAAIVHLRPSGNAPEMRCYVEHDRPEAAAELLRTMLGRLQEK